MQERSLPWAAEEPYARDLGVEVHADEADVRLELPFAEPVTMFGVIHGGALASLVPISALASMASGGRACTVSMHVVYVRAARRAVTARTRVVRQVHELGFFETRVDDDEGKPIVRASATASASPAEAAENADLPAWSGASAGAEVRRAIEQGLAASPFLARRQVGLVDMGRGVVELALPAVAANLDRDGAVHEGAALALLDAAGATCPWSTATRSAGPAGATIALSAEFFGALPAGGLIARATLRVTRGAVHWVDVAVADADSRRLHARGTVVYRLGEGRAQRAASR
jgi:uncharacterized protein (TIGR00369 family)